MRSLIDPGHAELSVRRQCQSIGLSRATYYRESAENLALVRLTDEQITRRLVRHGREVSRKRVRRLLRLMGLEAIHPKPRLSAGRGHEVYPYMLRDVPIDRVGQVWSADITYLPMASGFMYLSATIDWFSRFVAAWRLSNTLDGVYRDTQDEALATGTPEAFNTDPGCSSRPGRGSGGPRRPGCG